MSRREKVFDAAIDVLAVGGGRGLTHRSVDKEAGLPDGTTSNYARTRQHLMVGARDRLVLRQAETSAAVTPPAPTTEAELVTALGALLDGRLADPRETIAHTVLLFEAVAHEELRAGLDAETTYWQETFASWLQALGASDPEAGAILILAYMYSLMFGECVDPAPDFDAEEAFALLVHGLLH